MIGTTGILEAGRLRARRSIGRSQCGQVSEAMLDHADHGYVELEQKCQCPRSIHLGQVLGSGNEEGARDGQLRPEPAAAPSSPLALASTLRPAPRPSSATIRPRIRPAQHEVRPSSSNNYAFWHFGREPARVGTSVNAGARGALGDIPGSDKLDQPTGSSAGPKLPLTISSAASSPGAGTWSLALWERRYRPACDLRAGSTLSGGRSRAAWRQ